MRDYELVLHEFAVPTDDPETEAVGRMWCVEGPDRQRFTLMAVSAQADPREIPEVLRDLAAALNAGRALRLGLPIVGLTT